MDEEMPKQPTRRRYLTAATSARAHGTNKGGHCIELVLDGWGEQRVIEIEIDLPA